MFSRFFIERPIFASVIAIIFTLAGLVASQVLPIAQYPEIAPPTVTITTTLPGASAETLSRTVAAPIEEQLSGVEGLLYFQSTSSSNGTLTITCTFEVGTDVNNATIQVNNRVQIALPRLPDDVRRTGVVVQKRSLDILMFVAVTSTDPRYDTLYLSNYMTINALDVLKRVPGVADSTIFGARDYSMRIWLRPDKMAQLGVTATDVAAAIRAQNAQYAAGKIGQDPAPGDQSLIYTVTAQGRLVQPEEFGNIVLRSSGPGGVLRIRDIARIELGAINYDSYTTVDGRPTIGTAVYLQSGANALNVANSVRRTMDEIAKGFPSGVSYIIPFDTTRFVQASIREVVHTLFIAALLVLAVVFVFLQSWRATLIPFIAVPISLIGSFAGLYAFGYSINTLTLFAIVLATGIVVDDAIVVLENVERLMSEKGLSPKEAAIESMREVTGAIIAIELVLCSVFVPVAFLGGLAGRLYQQFAVTVTTAVVISGVVALTLTPALCALLLKRSHGESPLFRPFNRGFAALVSAYTRGVRWVAGHAAISLALFALVIAATVGLLRHVPGSLVPLEDQGYLFGAVVLPDGATLSRTGKVGAAMQKALSGHPAVEHVFLINGFDLIGGGNKTSSATLFITLKPWDERSAAADDIVKFVGAKGAGVSEGLVFAFNPVPIRGLGTAGGMEMFVQSRADADARKLAGVVQQFVGDLRKQSDLTAVNTFFRAAVPQIFVEVDREKAISLGVPVGDVFDALQSTMGALYVNDFNKFGRTFRVQLQAESQFRARPEDLGNVYVRSGTTGQMLPLGSLLKILPTVGPDQIDRFNGFVSAKVLAATVPGVSSGQGIATVERAARETLPAGYFQEWTGQAFQEKRAGRAAIIAFSFALVMVFLILSANYERWSLPVAVLLSVPFALLGAFLAVLFRGMSNDVYFQIGLVTLIGLAAKNAILIVEFAAQNAAQGMPAFDAAVTAARQRFRPIVMTSLAFVLGVLPLALATGAGGAARRSMGTGVEGGMLAATFVATLFVPLFFILLTERRAAKRARRPARETGA
ncbi:MAG TPA: multidrug efflux RND transporter permease subunit [Burkholderiales bacterium]|nr:multidrug efflux RND transporter permease subunit [Burkholderiales bacterium]